MKLLSVILASCLPAFALDIPRSVFTLEQLAEAQAEAHEESEPVVFVYTDPSST